MGMLVDGKWERDADRSMVSGVYNREQSAMPTTIDAETLNDMGRDVGRFYLIASASCPWSHGAVIALALADFGEFVQTQWAGGERVEGYGLLAGGPLPNREVFQHLHQFYTATDSNFTGRATVPVLWDAKVQTILSNSSADIIDAFDQLGELNLRPAGLNAEIDALNDWIFEGLSNAVYRAGKAQVQAEYDEAVNTVFETLDILEERLVSEKFLFGQLLTFPDVRLFATLVRFDTVYATHFRCTLRRLVDYPNLWRFTRRIYQMPGINETVDFDQIRQGYYLNDGTHNPFGIVGLQPDIDWELSADL